jgi:hypothetical protein
MFVAQQLIKLIGHLTAVQGINLRIERSEVFGL